MIPNLKYWTKKLFHSNLSFPSRHLLLTIAVQDNSPGFPVLAEQTGIQLKRIPIYFNEALKNNWIDSNGNIILIQEDKKEQDKERTKEKEKERKEESNISPAKKCTENQQKNPTLSRRTKSPQNNCFLIAKKISNIVQKYKNINYPTTIVLGWSKEIKKLWEYGVSFERMNQALNWYENNQGDTYCPVIESGKTFKKKFTKLEYQMNKNFSKNKTSIYSSKSKKIVNTGRK